MLFNSFQFAVFFVGVLILYFGCPPKHRWYILLVASLYFYGAWNAQYLLLLLATSLIDYLAAIKIGESSNPVVRRLWLYASMGSNLLVLCTFKYFDFFASNIAAALNAAGVATEYIPLNLVLPVGISFYTFQAMNYTIDVYRKLLEPERNVLRFLLFICFFPQLVAGPIERATNLLRQVQHPTYFKYENFRVGVPFIFWGLFKKICIADLLASFVNGVYASPETYNGSILLIATFFFAIEIYCDFSGYSDIATGTAKILGFDLMINFRQPYLSRSLQEFWQSWHISLSTWFKDYVYMPLGGNRVPFPRWALNVLIVFILSGIWHGANWTFFIWGAIHGGGLVAERLFRHTFRHIKLALPKPLLNIGLIATTNVIVLVTWVFFRAESLSDALHILKTMPELGPVQYGTFKLLQLPSFELLLVLCHIAVLMLVDAILKFSPAIKARFASSSVLRWCTIMLLVYDIALFGVFEKVEFIYFQF